MISYNLSFCEILGIKSEISQKLPKIVLYVCLNGQGSIPGIRIKDNTISHNLSCCEISEIKSEISLKLPKNSFRCMLEPDNTTYVHLTSRLKEQVVH